LWAAASERRLLSGKRSHSAILQEQPCRPLIEGSFREAAAAAFDIAYWLGRRGRIRHRLLARPPRRLGRRPVGRLRQDALTRGAVTGVVLGRPRGERPEPPERLCRPPGRAERIWAEKREAKPWWEETPHGRQGPLAGGEDMSDILREIRREAARGEGTSKRPTEVVPNLRLVGHRRDRVRHRGRRRHHHVAVPQVRASRAHPSARRARRRGVSGKPPPTRVAVVIRQSERRFSFA
jgi:hypothetical protein